MFWKKFLSDAIELKLPNIPEGLQETALLTNNYP